MEFLPGFLFDSWLGHTVWVWLLFAVIVVALLAFDLGVLHRKPHEISARESLLLSAGYIAVALVYGGFVWFRLGSEAGVTWYTGYLLEKTLALDNIFVISLIFTTLAIPPKLQHRVLFYGILGVVLLRGVMIGLGAALVSQFEWVLLAFGALLIVTGIRMVTSMDDGPGIAGGRIRQILGRWLPMTEKTHGTAFFVREPTEEGGKPVLLATPLMVALILIEIADIVFAVDSVPAIFGITTDPYIVYTSNIFAVLGLRALYFALAASVQRFRYLKYALAAVLIFIGAKIFWGHFVGKVDPLVALGTTAAMLAAGILFSMWKTRRDEASTPDEARAAPDRAG
ncbi:Integral membrane protein TerC [Rhodovulum sp. PH10]|uniref:TerC family protein n=1 Tax=Rhodovulum sp. PH10 TaxID=1187851 RepID=UPI00027C24F3|nr:TerC family protein [Rhodovulum sp. PH10]EJW12296.1 Integral membrane protein TerC [Rhodovulum sp. PH10]